MLENYNVINCRATTDSLYVALHVALIVKDNTFFLKLTISLVLRFSGRSNIEGVMFITAEMSTFLHTINCV